MSEKNIFIVYESLEDLTLTQQMLSACQQVNVSEACHFETPFLAKMDQQKIDLMVVDIAKPNEVIFETVKVLNEFMPVPILCFVDQATSEDLKRSVEVGMSVFCVDGKQAHRIEGLIDLAEMRFKQLIASQREIEQLKYKLSNRAVIEKAKGLISEKKQMSEEQAYSLLRTVAMNEGKRIADVAKEFTKVLSSA